MIPEIGIIIGVYAIVRFVEILSSAESRFASKAGQGLTKALAGCCLLVVAFLTLDLIMAGVSGRSPVAPGQVEMPSLFNPPTPTKNRLSPEEYRRQKEAADAEAERILRDIKKR